MEHHSILWSTKSQSEKWQAPQFDSFSQAPFPMHRFAIRQLLQKFDPVADADAAVLGRLGGAMGNLTAWRVDFDHGGVELMNRLNNARGILGVNDRGQTERCPIRPFNRLVET